MKIMKISEAFINSTETVQNEQKPDFKEAFENSFPVEEDIISDIDKTINSIRMDLASLGFAENISIIPETVTDDISVTDNETTESVSKKKSEVQLSVIQKHFERKKLVVAASHEPENFEALKSLSFQIGENYDDLSGFLLETKRAVTHPDRRIVYHVDDNAERSKVVRCTAEMFVKYGLLSSYTFSNNTIKAVVPRAPKITAYLTGYWLEHYSALVIQETVEKFAKERGYNSEVLMNVKLRNAGQESGVYVHEMDVVFSIKNVTFAVEAKCGSFNDYSVLCDDRTELGFIPDRYLLLQVNLGDDARADVLQYFYEYFIADLKSFRSKLDTMLKKAFP